jgi:cysteine-rich repeat protein
MFDFFRANFGDVPMNYTKGFSRALTLTVLIGFGAATGCGDDDEDGTGGAGGRGGAGGSGARDAGAGTGGADASAGTGGTAGGGAGGTAGGGAGGTAGGGTGGTSGSSGADSGTDAEAGASLCGNGNADQGEACDDGNTTPMDGCSVCTTTCDACNQALPDRCTVTNVDIGTKACADFGDATITTGPALGERMVDVCHEVLNCILRTKCAQAQVVDCYCGENNPRCLEADGANGPCKQEIERGLGTQDPNEISIGMIDATFAGGVGAFTALCLRETCHDACFSNGTAADAALD